MGRIVFVSFLMVLVAASATFALPGKKVAENGNKHNLRSSNILVTYRAAVNPADRRNDEICIFCHTPHNATPATPLWGRKQTVTSTFGHYSSTTLYIHGAGKALSGYNEPNFSSRLCLSCHDGATALGAVLNGPEISFDVGKEKIAPSGYNIFNPNQGNNDATQHHHPISFKYNTDVKNGLNSAEGKTYKLPTENKTGGPPYYNFPDVKIDRNGYMQCSTCHNPHQNMSDSDATTPFWVLTNAKAAVPPGGDGNGNVYDSVCLSCHPSDLQQVNPPTDNSIKNPYPY